MAVMAIFLLPGSVTAPVYAQEATTTPAVAALDGEPSKRLAASHEVAPSYTVSLTAYNAVPGQTDGDPSVTASGSFSNPEVVAARSRDLAGVLPFGTVIKIERTGNDTPRCQFSRVESLIGYRVVLDTMDARWENKLDVLFDAADTVSVNGKETNPSAALGVCGQVTATVVGHVDPRHVPKTQAELAAMFTDASLAIR